MTSRHQHSARLLMAKVSNYMDLTIKKNIVKILFRSSIHRFCTICLKHVYFIVNGNFHYQTIEYHLIQAECELGTNNLEMKTMYVPLD
jgi:hypothetical protein